MITLLGHTCQVAMSALHSIRYMYKFELSTCVTSYYTTVHVRTLLQYSSVDSAAEAHPHIDYTPPHYITLLFTDLGVLTPSAVSDELIKLYQ